MIARHAALILLVAGPLAMRPTDARQARQSDPPRPRVIVSSDIGGTDPDDFQSMAHFLLYADRFEVEGLISSPFGPGRQAHIRRVIFTGLTTAADLVEAFGVVEFVIPTPAAMTPAQSARMIFDNRIPAVATREGRMLRFRFSPRDAKVWPYVIKSDVAELDGLSGQFTAHMPPADRTSRPSSVHPHWWTDDPTPSAAEGVHAGARSVSMWRQEFLRDFAERLRWAQPPSVPAR